MTTDSAIEAALSSTLREELARARWYQGKARELRRLSLVDRVAIPGSGNGILAIVAAERDDGIVEDYAIVLRADAGGRVQEALPTDTSWQALARLAGEGGGIEAEHGALVASSSTAAELPSGGGASRALQADQSNTSVVIDERAVLKLYRRLRPGVGTEQELLRGLTEVGSARAPALHGALTYNRDGTSTALAIVYAFVEGEPVGWEPAITALAAALGGPATSLERLAAEAAELGRCAADLHRDLLLAFGSSTAGAADAEARRAKATARAATAIASVTRVAPELAALGPATEFALGELAGAEGCELQRIHGDLHVGQLLRGPSGVVAIDFEGDPTLPPAERRESAPALQDVASLLLSLDHVAVAAARRSEAAGAEREALAWSAAAREALLAGYGAPGPRTPLLHALEVEKEWREALYAARVLPGWLYAPRSVLLRLLA